MPTATAPAAASAAPWALVDTGVPEAAQEAASSISTGAFEVRVEPLAGVSGEPPAGLWAVVGQETALLDTYDDWSRRGIAFVVLDPSSLTAGEKTSTLGPELAHDEAGFLAGVAAGLASQTGLVGLLPGVERPEVDDYRAGFAEGLLYTCPKCRLEDVADPSRPTFGMDVVGVPPWSEWPAAEPEAGVPWLVVFGEPPSGAWAERVAARVNTAPEAITVPALTDLWEGSEGETWVFTASDGGLMTFVDPRAISPGRERLLREAEAALADGWLVVGGGE